MFVWNKVEGLTVEGITFENAPNHHMEVVEGVRTRLRGLTITAPYSARNTDGINFYGGFDSSLSDTVIDNGDDCVSVVPIGDPNICVNANWTDQACSGGHVIVSNLTCNGGHGLSIGGIRHGNVRNVTFVNITATGGQSGSTQDEAAAGGCRIKSYPNSTGLVSDIRYQDMVMRDVYMPLQLLGHYCPFPCNTPDGNSATQFDSISFENVVGTGRQRRGAVAEFKCSSYAPCTNLTLRGVQLTDSGGSEGHLTCENVEGVHIDGTSAVGTC